MMQPSRRHILIVEDNAAIREALAEILVEEGYAVSEAADGLQALRRLQGVRPMPDLILLDLMMPVMNGFEFREKQLNDGALADIPVAVITADGQAQDRAERLRAAAFLRKPIKIQALLDVMDRLLK